MSISFSVLGSGSRGNCTLIVFRSDDDDDRFALIDCGLSRRETISRLAPFGVTLDDVTEIFITHFDTDHFQPSWSRFIEDRGIRVHAHRRHRAQAVRSGLTGRTLDFFDDAFEIAQDTCIVPHLVAHDSLGTISFVFEHRGARLGFATDLGRVTNALCAHLSNVHGLAIESNYDRAMQLASARPSFLKTRIMGGRGHLSNEESMDTVLMIQDGALLKHVVPLHLSRECNDPRLITHLYADRAPELLDSLTITNQYRATPLLEVDARESPAPSRALRHGLQTRLF